MGKNDCITAINEGTMLWMKTRLKMTFYSIAPRNSRRNASQDRTRVSHRPLGIPIFMEKRSIYAKWSGRLTCDNYGNDYDSLVNSRMASIKEP